MYSVLSSKLVNIMNFCCALKRQNPAHASLHKFAHQIELASLIAGLYIKKQSKLKHVVISLINGSLGADTEWAPIQRRRFHFEPSAVCYGSHQANPQQFQQRICSHSHLLIYSSPGSAAMMIGLEYSPSQQPGLLAGGSKTVWPGPWSCPNSWPRMGPLTRGVCRRF